MSDFRFKHGKWFGLAGLPSHEHALAHQWHRRFEWLLVPMVLWLPLQMLFEHRGVMARDQAHAIDWVIWSAFLMELITMLAMVHHRMLYLRGNWLNLVILVVAFPLLKSHTAFATFAVLFRSIMLITVLARLGVFMRSLLQRNQLGSILIGVAIIAVLGGTIISLVDPAFKSVWDGIWWACVTITTVGYGDLVPSTGLGRGFAVILMIMGVGLIALLSATMAELFLENEERRMYRQGAEILRRLGGQFDEFQKAKEDREEMMRMLRQLSDRLEHIERQLKRNDPR